VFTYQVQFSLISNRLRELKLTINKNVESTVDNYVGKFTKYPIEGIL